MNNKFKNEVTNLLARNFAILIKEITDLYLSNNNTIKIEDNSNDKQSKPNKANS